jgi:DNA-binding NarL/FixJ family response regulator
LFLSTDTVKSHIRRAYRKLGVNSREEAVRMAIEAGMFEGDGGDPDLPRAAFRGN